MSDRTSRLEAMQREYHAQAESLGDQCPAWLSAIGQLDVAHALELERKDATVFPGRYAEFLSSKKRHHVPAGFENHSLNKSLYPFQKRIVEWALRLGRAGIFADCGLGKTLMQLAWAQAICEKTGGKVLILAPLAVNRQTQREGERFGIKVKIARKQEDCGKYGVHIANYEMLSHFDAREFVGVVLDESSILKSYSGKIRNQIIESFAGTRFRLACTATPSPNDHMELGNHSEFLGVQTRTGMLATYFNHDGGETSKWKLKGHAEGPFYKFLASWAVMIEKPSDMGFSDDGYNIPPMERHFHVVNTDVQEGVLFPVEAKSMNERRASRKVSVSERVEKVAALVNASKDQWLIWCGLNPEGDAAEKAIPTAVQVAGADTDKHKEDAFLGFADGAVKDLITKAKIGGFGMNWQNCSNMASLGLSDSFEQLYQMERRCWRYGQKRPVNHHIFVTDRDGAVIRNILRKQGQVHEMSQRMKEEMRRLHG